MFENPKNRAIFSLTTRGVVDDNTGVKFIGSTICSNKILPDVRAELGNREVPRAPIKPHNSAPALGNSFAHNAQKAGVSWNL